MVESNQVKHSHLEGSCPNPDFKPTKDGMKYDPNVAEEGKADEANERVPITDVTNMLISEEFGDLLDRFPNIDEVEFEALSPYVMQYYIQSYAEGNSMDMEGEELRYLSNRFILVGTKLGCAT